MKNAAIKLMLYAYMCVGVYYMLYRLKYIVCNLFGYLFWLFVWLFVCDYLFAMVFK